MSALITIALVFLICFIAMLGLTHNAMPYDPAWDEWETDNDKRG